MDAEGDRANESSGLGLDGFEILDLSSCLTAPHGTMSEGLTTAEKREACRPETYRYRYPSVDMALGHTNQGSIYGCHELEVHPNDVLTCGSGGAMIALDMAGVFADLDGDDLDEVRGDALPCRRRASTSAEPFTTGAPIVDCVEGVGGQDLSVAGWTVAGAPSVEGIEWLGSAYHMGRESTTGALQPAFPSTEDIDFDHEAELTHSGRFAIATDERGGGVAAGAQCSPGVDLDFANGGIHAYRMDRLQQGTPATAEEAFEAYARTPDGDKAIARAPINTQPQGTECTAHVFHQVPGQNRIFMGWYSQGTQVFDYVEGVDAETGEPTFEWHHVGHFTPEYANTWVSAVFDVEENEDGSFTYHGATGDFNAGNGRSAIDIYRVTLPAPHQFADGSTPGDPDDGERPERPECDDDRPGQQPPHCDDDGRPGNDGARGDDDPDTGGPAGTPAGTGRDRGGPAEASQGRRSGSTHAAGTGTAPAPSPTPTQVIDLRPVTATASRAPVSPASAATGASLLAGGLLLAIGVQRRRRRASAA